MVDITPTLDMIDGALGSQGSAPVPPISGPKSFQNNGPKSTADQTMDVLQAGIDGKRTVLGCICRKFVDCKSDRLGGFRRNDNVGPGKFDSRALNVGPGNFTPSLSSPARFSRSLQEPG
jgi:hypothetical protein